MSTERLKSLREFIQGLVIISLILVVIYNVTTFVGVRHVVVVQSPITGNLTYHSEPGVIWTGFGRVIKYEKTLQFWFSADVTDIVCH